MKTLRRSLLFWTQHQITQVAHPTASLVSFHHFQVTIMVSCWTSSSTGQAWIGLSDDLENGWRWSLSNSIFYSQDERQFKNWDYGYPLGGPNRCVELFGDVIAQGKWGDAGCDSKRPFVCYSGECRLWIYPSKQVKSVVSNVLALLIITDTWLHELILCIFIPVCRLERHFVCEDWAASKLDRCTEILQKELCRSGQVQ